MHSIAGPVFTDTHRHALGLLNSPHNRQQSTSWYRPKRGMNQMSVSFTVIICAYTEARWDRLREAVASIEAQTLHATQTILCIDHNARLAERCRRYWGDRSLGLTVIENHYPGRLGSARNSGMECAHGDVVAFLDDDAAAQPDWLERLAEIYARNPSIHAVGCAPLPVFETQRPAWFPFEFDWIFGCAYRGLPTQRAPVGRLIGAAMSVRRASVLAVGGFHSDDHDDMDLTHRIIHEYGAESVLYDSTITVSHFVTAQRVTWSYFWRRCFVVNRGKVLAFADMGAAADRGAEIGFVLRLVFIAVPGYLVSSQERAPRRAFSALVGVLAAAAGHVAGTLALMSGRTEPSLTKGLEHVTAAGPVVRR